MILFLCVQVAHNVMNTSSKALPKFHFTNFYCSRDIQAFNNLSISINRSREISISRATFIAMPQVIKTCLLISSTLLQNGHSPHIFTKISKFTSCGKYVMNEFSCKDMEGRSHIQAP